jgi:hypothetical protein
VRVRENGELQARIDRESAITAPKWAEFKRARGWPEVMAKRENPDGMKKLQTLFAARS